MVEGAPHTAKRSMINLCINGVPPSPVYKGVEEGRGRPSLWRAPWGVLLGNVVISKISLRTRKIMVMHSNERGECCPRTLVDRKRKR